MVDSGLTRFQIGKVSHSGGQQFVDGSGYANDGYERVHRPEPHGFASHPVAGGIGLFQASRNNRDSGYVLGGEHPALRPDLPMGGTAFYDHMGNIIKMIGGDGAVFDFGSRSATFTAGDWTINAPNGVTINGPLTVTGDITVTGGINASGSIVDGDGDGGA